MVIANVNTSIIIADLVLGFSISVFTVFDARLPDMFRPKRNSYVQPGLEFCNNMQESIELLINTLHENEMIINFFFNGTCYV